MALSTRSGAGGGRGRSRTRDYAAEYARRKARGLRLGKTTAEARGHKNESAEKKQRRQRIRAKYGVSPERLSRLRKETTAHILGILSSGTKGRVDADAVAKRVGRMSQPMMDYMQTLDRPRYFAFSYDDIDFDPGDFDDDDRPNFYR